MPLLTTFATASAESLGFGSLRPLETLGGMVLMTPTSITSTGTGNSSSIGENGSVTFSSCETLSLNGVFTSQYDYYMIQMRYVSDTIGKELRARLRASGTDNSTTGSYIHQRLTASSTAVSAVRTGTNTFEIGNSDLTLRSGIALYLYGPFLVQPTAVRSVTVGGQGNAIIVDYAATHNQSVSYDGISLFASTGLLTGLVSVYGLK